MSNKEIAEYCNCDVRDVYFALNNETGDNLSEDHDYLDGKLGDIVNIDNVDESMLKPVYHVDEKLDKDEDEDMSNSGGEEQTQQEPLANGEDPRAKAYPTPESDPPYNPPLRGYADDTTYDSEDEIERILSATDLDEPEDEEMYDVS
ncbi:uncharacterized protein PHACADRAFT_248258 [Phanerochaete carnosa HHB-10118-sp]|uniref:Uncharacterized protein n=1 Tax=Phanerochaete carnosa (strain HHB-10118-sp) TaxID=650164 RepID=K5WC86_PHACS|nr:uncharacterized protein PHACADRAFT_248258 [Phanerochaete carnosa HHB-10118-sp]EKM61573.1 hypothetical protein PHACADRAFT_248258 [Phanerochaete carnosa HHB-10118-sp]